MYQKGRTVFDWAITITVYVLVLLVIPITDRLIPNMDTKEISIILDWIINMSIIAIFVCLFIYLLKKGKQTEGTSYVWLVFFFIISLYSLAHIESTKDRLHLLGYGMLSVLLYLALRHHIATYMLYAWSAFLIIIFAILDESLQQFGVGGRGFEFKDIVTDSLSGAGGQLLIALVVRPKLEKIDIKMYRYMKALKRQNDFQKFHTPKF